MPEAFKNFISPATVAQAAQHLARAWPAFNRTGFAAQALHGLEALELKQRAMQLADALHAHLPPDLPQAAQVLEAALAPPVEPDAPGSAHPPELGLSGWVVWPMTEVVARRALAEPAQLPRALQALHALTQRFSAEFAIRPLLRDHPGVVLPTLHSWLNDPSAHVRRLVSEGSRPRLPWGLRLQALVADPRPTLPLLAALQDDPSDYVRRSVANHLNDIAKDHPALVADWLEAHLPGASTQRRALLRHASRSLIKAGDARVLAAWGVGAGLQGSVSLSVAPSSVAVGGEVNLLLVLRSTSAQTQNLVVDYAVHHIGARGQSTPKVFKGWKLVLAPGEHRVLEKRHSLRPITTRRYYPGWHRVTVQVNGQALGEAGFTLRLG